MTLRRDFLAFTACAVAGRTVLPAPAKVEPDDRRGQDIRRQLLLVFSQLGEPEQVALLRGMERQQAGMPMLEAVRSVYLELGRPLPANLMH